MSTVLKSSENTAKTIEDRIEFQKDFFIDTKLQPQQTDGRYGVPPKDLVILGIWD